MVLLSLFLASALVVRQDGTELRTSCESDGKTVATVAASSPVEVRFSIATSAGACFKVGVTAAGGLVEGYLPASALSGTEEFDAGVRSAPTLGASGAGARSAPYRSKGSGHLPAPVAIQPTAHPLLQASSLLNARQPGAALEAAEQGMKVHGRSYQFLVLAGLAAQAADQSRQALDYLREAQTIQQDRSIEQVIARLEKELAGDKSSEKLYGNRFVLRFEGGVLDPDVARSMVALLEQEFSRVSAELGCRTDERIVTVLQSRQAYRETSSVAEWSAGHFDGSRIRIPVAEGKTVSPQTRETFTHELVHACLANLGDWPAWLHEGFAQKLTGRTPNRGTRERILAMLRDGKLPRLENMSQSWSRMSGEHAMIAYQYALIGVETLYELYSGFGVQNVLRAPQRIPDVTARIDAHLTGQ